MTTIENMPKSGSINDLPPEVLDDFLDKINHIKKEGYWETFKRVGRIDYTNENVMMFYSEGNIIVFKRLNDEEVLVYNIEFEKYDKE